MSEQIDQVEVLEKEGPGSADSLRSIGVEDGRAVGGGVDRCIRILGMTHT
jgi:hypothetical protein